MRKWMAALALFAMVGLALVVTSGSAAAAEDQFSGTGVLVANGSGVASVSGSGAARVRGGGVLKITDNAGDAVIKINGNGVSVNQGQVTVYAGFTGEVTVVGSNFTLELVGRDVRLEAVGNGTVKLAGVGFYLYKGTAGYWTIPAIEIPISR